MLNQFGVEEPDKSNDSSLPAELLESSSESPNIQNHEAMIQTNSEAAQSTGFGRRPRKKVSKVWNDVIEVTEDGVVKCVKCKHCGHIFKKGKSGSTSQFKRHIDTCPRRSAVIIGQSRLSVHKGIAGDTVVSNLKPWKFDNSRIRELMSHMVMVHGLPFAFAEYELFNLLMKEASPEFRKVSRNTLKANCKTSYENEKKRLVSLLKSVKRVSVTTDIWRSDQTIEYMVVTCHFVSDWKLQKRVLNFCQIPPPHNGVAVCDALNQCMMEWNLSDKLASITIDNASYNDDAIKKFKDVLSSQGKLPFGGLFFHIRCCVHIVNILVQEALKQIEGIIHNVRETVKHIDKSSHRINLFNEVVKSWRLPGKKLILDCPTRWNSTFQMLSCALDYEEKDPSYTNKPCDEDWIKGEKICSFLRIFNDITETISGTEYPTSNLFLTELAQIKEELEKVQLQ